MTIALITPEPPLEPDHPATGNQVRAEQIRRGLIHHGLEVRQLWRDRKSGGKAVFDGPKTLAGTLNEIQPTAVLSTYWELLEWLPAEPGIPVAVDCVAPRPLEYHFEDPPGTTRFLARYVQALARADRIICGNRQQARWMNAWLLGAGMDLRGKTPILILPLSCNPDSETRPNQPGGELNLATGGRDWPWRQSTDWLEALAQAGPGIRLHLVGEHSPTLSGNATRHGFVAHDQWRRWIRSHAHLGLELADENIERRASQSFRATDFIEAGVPLLLNDYLPLAEAVSEYGAGWVADSPARAVEIAQALAGGELDLGAAAEGAARLARERLDFTRTTGELAGWLAAPEPARRFALPGPASRQSSRPVDNNETRGWRTASALIARAALRPFRRKISGNGVVVVTRSDLFPADHGAAVRILETARSLALQSRAVAIVTGDRACYQVVEDGRFETRRLPLWLRLLAPPKALIHGIHLLLGRPTSNGFLYWPMLDPFYGLRAAWVGRKIKAGIYLAEFPAYARSARQARLLNDGLVVLVEHNVEYRRLAEQLPDLGQRQQAWFRRMEIDACNRVDAVVCVSEPDRDQLVADGADGGRIRVIPHGVDVDGISGAKPLDLEAEYGIPEGAPVLVYHGTFAYPPNAEAIESLAREILPRLFESHPGIHVLAIGSRPPPGIDQERIHFAGSLEELGPALHACTLAAVPLASGGGTRMKILDYFAAGLPVVSTSKGCEGIPVTDGQHLLIRDDHDGFADAVAGLLSDPRRARELGDGGHRFARRLDWKRIGEKYEALFGRLETGR